MNDPAITHVDSMMEVRATANDQPGSRQQRIDLRIQPASRSISFDTPRQAAEDAQDLNDTGGGQRSDDLQLGNKVQEER
jgi:hypothetical protein